MAELGPVVWPPAPLRTERLVLREPEPETVRRSLTCSLRQRCGRTSVAPDRVLSLRMQCLKCPGGAQAYSWSITTGR